MNQTGKLFQCLMVNENKDERMTFEGLKHLKGVTPKHLETIEKMEMGSGTFSIGKRYHIKRIF